MNTPNKLTLARMIATPIFMATMLINFPYHYAVSLVLFALASLTDMIDGKMARKYNLVTDFGKFLDPLADKMLTTSAYLGFMFLYSAQGGAYGWQITTIVFIVLFREFMVSSLRLVTAKSGLVVAANIWGKLKTVTQMIAITLAFIDVNGFFAFIGTKLTGFGLVLNVTASVIMLISVVATIFSGIDYIKGGKDLLKD